MRHMRRSLVAVLGAGAILSCGGGTPIAGAPIPSSFDVRVSAGTPVAGAMVTVYAINDATGEVNGTVGVGGVLGSGGPTDTGGRVIVATRTYSGPVQIVASGPALFYADPTRTATDGSPPPFVQLPSSLTLSSYVGKYTSSDSMLVPVTFLTTLADHGALAYARGRHPAHPRRTTLTEALAARDPLFIRHVTRGGGWDPATLRTTVPASLTGGPQSLVDVAFAALFDLGLNQLARVTSALAGYADGAAGIDAPTLLQLLEQDIDADGTLDGRGEGGTALFTPGATPVRVDEQFLRLPLGKALQAWINDAALNKSGLREVDLIGGQVFTAVVEDHSDLLGGAPAASADVLIDTTPPVLTWADAPPVAVMSSTAVVRVTATDDLTGVRRVLGQVGPDAAVVGTLQPDGNWELVLHLQAGPNHVSIWGEDNAPLSPNSGQFDLPPYQLTATVIYDTTPAVVLYNSGFASYRDERGMTVAVDPEGHAVVPPVYSCPGAPITIPPAGGHVYKAATRLAWTSPPTVAALEDPISGNPDNIPVLQFAIPYTPGVSAPITGAMYAVDVACPGCSFAPAAGPLWLSNVQSPTELLFDLPLSANLVPALSSLPGPADVTVTISIADAAGNVATETPISLTFHTIGPPLSATEDASYGAQNDTKSTYPYSILNGLYSTLFDPATAAFLPENKVRLVRYIVENPAPMSVGLSLPSFDAGWRVVETWTGDPGVSLGSISFSVSRTLCSNTPSCSGATPVSYGGGSAGVGCGTSPPHNMTPATDTPFVATGALSSFAYNQYLGGDLSPALKTGGGQVIVPPASGNTPGTVALYLA